MPKVDLYTTVSQDTARLIAQEYSTSFSWAMSLLDEPVRTRLYNIYGFVRVADELVDTLRPSNAQQLLTEFEAQTFQAIESKVSLNPVIYAFARTVRTCKIPPEYIRAFFTSMAMDLKKTKYSQKEYQTYIYGSAEVIGLMALWVFVDGKKMEFLKTEAGARALGAAFQKVNFLRDIKADNLQLGRVYFPGVDFRKFSLEQKKQIEADIMKDFITAKPAIRELPPSSRYGVWLAYRYYLTLFDKIQKLTPKELKAQRVRVNNMQKAMLYALVYT